MVGEFPELQGLMGGYYAAAQGEDPAVAAAIRDHYKPVGPGDDVPTDPVTVAVSLADKLDTLTGFFAHQLPPTGSKDPFALRRAAISVLSLIIDNGIHVRMRPLLAFVAQSHFIREHTEVALLEIGKASDLAATSKFWQADVAKGFSDGLSETALEEWRNDKLIPAIKNLSNELFEFFVDRLKVQQREAGVRHDLIDTVFALGGEDDLVRLLARVHALQAFVATEDGANLLAGYKRAANILKKELPSSPLPVGEGQGASALRGEGEAQSAGRPHPSAASPLPPSPNGRGTYVPEPAEAALIAALDSAEPRAASAVAAEDFAGAMAALASLRAPIDAFFNSVTVNDPDPAKRSARLALLERVRAAVHNVADFSKVEG